mmetsp:Transcript_105634/g.147268  ORF Transcript_105634/g.147268 Transcript_105634/m.147268 type:complete len:123 (+) Transcript_105634:60-428(+)
MFCACCQTESTPKVVETVGIPLSTSTDHAAAAATVEDEGAVFTFELPDKSTKEIFFPSKPLGLDFSKSIPMTVKGVKKDSHADQANIQPKWVVTHVQGQPLPTEFHDAMMRIFEVVRALPDK